LGDDILLDLMVRPANRRVEQTGPGAMMLLEVPWAGSSRARRWADLGAEE
jgi:hypothetical protein